MPGTDMPETAMADIPGGIWETACERARLGTLVAMDFSITLPTDPSLWLDTNWLLGVWMCLYPDRSSGPLLSWLLLSLLPLLSRCSRSDCSADLFPLRSRGLGSSVGPWWGRRCSPRPWAIGRGMLTWGTVEPRSTTPLCNLIRLATCSRQASGILLGKGL